MITQKRIPTRTLDIVELLRREILYERCHSRDKFACSQKYLNAKQCTKMNSMLSRVGPIGPCSVLVNYEIFFADRKQEIANWLHDVWLPHHIVAAFLR